MVTPITATWKLDLHELVLRKLNWDDVLPDNLRAVWVSHFQMMGEMMNLRYNRAIVPTDAANLNINTMDFGDASRSLVCVAIYARFLRKCDTYSCQLIFSRSRLISTRWDVSAKGRTLCCCGQHPFQGSSEKSTLQKIIKSKSNSQIAKLCCIGSLMMLVY